MGEEEAWSATLREGGEGQKSSLFSGPKLALRGPKLTLRGREQEGRTDLFTFVAMQQLHVGERLRSKGQRGIKKFSLT